jgi:hypothetical protein
MVKSSIEVEGLVKRFGEIRAVDLLLLVLFTLVFLDGSTKVLQRNMMKGL